MEAKEAQYAELIKLFAFVLNQLRLYSDKHPAAQLAGRNFSAMLQVVLELGTSVICGFVEGRLVINDCSFDSKTSGVRAMLELSQELQIEKLIFEPGSDEQEVKAMLNLMALPPKSVEARGGFKKVFEEANFVRIRLGVARHLLLGEDEEVVSKSKIGVNETVEEDPLSPQVQKTDRIEELIEHCITRTEATIEFDADRIVYDLERRVQESACQMVRRAEDVDMLRRIVDGIAYFLEQRLSPEFIEKGRDISLPIYRLAREYRKALGGTEGPEDFKRMSEELGGILERCADSIKLNVLTRAFVESGSDPRSLSRFLRSKEAHERLREPLKERLSSLGVSQSISQKTYRL